jgi:hypothetical protein
VSNEDLTESMCNTLAALCEATTREGAARWCGIEGLAVHKSSIYALDRRGLVVWNGYRARVKVTPAGWRASR